MSSGLLHDIVGLSISLLLVIGNTHLNPEFEINYRRRVSLTPGEHRALSLKNLSCGGWHLMHMYGCDGLFIIKCALGIMLALPGALVIQCHDNDSSGGKR